MYERVLALAHPHQEKRILDVGTTPDLEIPYNNFFERWYPRPEQITAASVEDCSNLEECFRGLKFRRIEGESLPFEDRTFDLAVSFAVLEHVGCGAKQRHFLGELSRVANAFVVYTPYRYFPIEMHTMLPLLHWLPTPWYRAVWRRCGLAFWADERNLNLLSLETVKQLLPSSGTSRVELLWTLTWPSNIEICWRAAP